MAFVFSREGPVEELGKVEELTEAPEAIETPMVLWHVVQRTLSEQLRTLEEEEQREEFAVRALRILAVRA